MPRTGDPVLPVGTVTLLLTGVEGSTAHWEGAPLAMSEALSRHDVLVERRPTVELDGVVFAHTKKL